MRGFMALSALFLLCGCIPQTAGPGYSSELPPQPVSYAAEAPREPVESGQSVPDPTADPGYDVRITNPAPPVWKLRTVTPDAQRVAPTRYTVRSGDTLRLIAVRTGAGSEAIARANDLNAPYTLQPGQTLVIPGGRYHLVREGETGIAIAQAYRTDWSKLIAANDLDEPYVLRAGMRLLIPENETIEQRAARFHLDLDVDDIVTGGQPALAAGAAPVKPSPSPRKPLPATAAVAVPARLNSGFAWPVRGSVIKHFGPGASGERNDGIKIAVPMGTPVLASADGVVAYAGSDIAALGGLVILRHGDGWTTVYGHAGQLLVQRGQSVKKGQAIALSGNSGFADRPEVHFEMRQGRTPVDPEQRLARR
ncbi:M23 family metallopeptidase [Sphingomonas sp.]|uniref:M23 family metallopeptidase n=1 Tax=Sphingomonas sp. TaxID=28214 RepID=UPI001B11BC53|nr:M23 family metallopeptidase [Sphingomonas sp.]MBO9712233.1 M23 family metallopeptidase [Sphingomonas sp.]